MLPGGPGVRVGIMLYPGYVVPPYRDSLLAKIIAHAKLEISRWRACNARSTSWKLEA
jgi:biotin carboxylase